MAQMGRVTIDWSGFVGAPGYTNLVFSPAAGGSFGQAQADAAATKTDTWLNAWFPSIPSGVVLRVRPTVEVFDDASGTLLSFLTVTTDSAEGGSASGGYSAAAGACVNWYTGGIRNGRRVRGRTFMVPLGGSGLQSNGTIDDTRLTAMRNANAALIVNNSDAKLAVWSRPSGPGATDGISYDVISTTQNDKTAILRSRRD